MKGKASGGKRLEGWGSRWFKDDFVWGYVVRKRRRVGPNPRDNEMIPKAQ